MSCRQVFRMDWGGIIEEEGRGLGEEGRTNWDVKENLGDLSGHKFPRDANPVSYETYVSRSIPTCVLRVLRVKIHPYLCPTSPTSQDLTLPVSYVSRTSRIQHLKGRPTTMCSTCATYLDSGRSGSVS